MAEDIYLCIISDVVGSRRYTPPERGEIQQRLLELTHALDADAGSELVASFQVVAGDEVQALLSGGSSVPDLVWRLSRQPFPIRIGIGAGSVDTAWNENVTRMDGPAFHEARKAIEDAAGSNRLGPMFSGFSTSGDVVLNAMSHEMEWHRSKMTRRQADMVDVAREGLMGTCVAERFEVTESAVSQHLKGAGWRAYAGAEKGVRAALAHFLAEVAR